MPSHRPTCDRQPGESPLIGMNSFFMVIVEHIIDNACEVCTTVSSSCVAQPFKLISSTSHHTGPLTAPYSGYRDLRCRPKTCTLSHLKLSVLLGTVYCDFPSHSFAFSQTQSQASGATCGPPPTANSPTTTPTSTRRYPAMIAIAIDKRWVSDARAESRLSNAAQK